MTVSASFRVIGHARTPYERREDAPHQPKGAEATIEISEEFRAGLADLASFDRIWLLFLFHRNEGWKAKVKPPRGGPKRGVFATRAPHRPSPIGLTCASLLSVDVETGALHVADVDLLDGTPIVDIKPYIRTIDSFPDASLGWLEEYAHVEPRLKKPPRSR